MCRRSFRQTASNAGPSPIGRCFPYQRSIEFAVLLESGLGELGAPDNGEGETRLLLCILIGEVPPPLRLLVDFVDVDSEKWSEYAATKAFPIRRIYSREARQLLRFDRRVARKANASIF